MKQIKTPDRSKEFARDKNQLSYSEGNHKTRRGIFARNVGKEERKRLQNTRQDALFIGDKLPKRLWEKGKSKFLSIRLRQEEKLSINELV